jgi:hypothetical protein
VLSLGGVAAFAAFEISTEVEFSTKEITPLADNLIAKSGFCGFCKRLLQILSIHLICIPAIVPTSI